MLPKMPHRIAVRTRIDEPINALHPYGDVTTIN